MDQPPARGSHPRQGTNRFSR